MVGQSTRLAHSRVAVSCCIKRLIVGWRRAGCRVHRRGHKRGQHPCARHPCAQHPCAQQPCARAHGQEAPMRQCAHSRCLVTQQMRNKEDLVPGTCVDTTGSRRLSNCVHLLGATFTQRAHQMRDTGTCRIAEPTGRRCYLSSHAAQPCSQVPLRRCRCHRGDAGNGICNKLGRLFAFRHRGLALCIPLGGRRRDGTWLAVPAFCDGPELHSTCRRQAEGAIGQRDEGHHDRLPRGMSGSLCAGLWPSTRAVAGPRVWPCTDECLLGRQR